MYYNIGGKIKTLAVWTFVVEAIGSIITGIALGVEEDELYFLLCLIGPIVAWVSSWILYAFGEMVEDIHAMRNRFAPRTEQDAIEEAKRKEKETAAIEKSEREAKEKAKRQAIEKAKRDIEERANRETLQKDFKTVPVMEKPTNFNSNNDWGIKELSVKQVFARYLDEDEWSEEYRYACYLELKKRLG